jgi:hypothetical protein
MDYVARCTHKELVAVDGIQAENEHTSCHYLHNL